MKGECHFDKTMPIEAKVSWAEKRILEGDCRHVARAEIWRGESNAYAVLGARCYSASVGFQCEKSIENDLNWFAERRLSRHRTALKCKISYYAMPNDHVQISRADGGEGPYEFVLPPIFSQGPTHHEGDFSVLFTPADAPKDASVDLSFEVWLDQPKNPGISNLALWIVIPPRSSSPGGTAQPRARTEGESKKMNEIEAGLVVEAIKFLAEGGFAFFKKILGQNSDQLIQLNIANIPTPIVTSDKPLEEKVPTAVLKDAGIVLSNYNQKLLKGEMDELDRLVQHLNNLKKNRWSAAGGVKDLASADDAIQETEANIEKVKENIWKILQEIGLSASLVRKA